MNNLYLIIFPLCKVEHTYDRSVRRPLRRRSVIISEKGGSFTSMLLSEHLLYDDWIGQGIWDTLYWGATCGMETWRSGLRVMLLAVLSLPL